MAGWWWVLPFVAGAAVIAGVGHRIASQWQPQGDDAAIAWLSRDVFTTHSPLLGMPSTVGGGDSTAHHWGPMLFWLFAIPERIGSASPVGMQLALLTLQFVMLGLIAWFAARRAGRLGALAILTGVAILNWSLGRDLLSSVWNPAIALLPLVATFVLAWSIADGDDLALVPMAFTASFVVQGNILYTPLVGLLVVWSMIGWFVTGRARRRIELDGATPAGDDTRPPVRRRRRLALVALGVLLVVWSGPIVHELTHQPGNISAVLTNGFGESGQHVGVRRAFNAVAWSIGIPPVWTSPSSGLDVSRHVADGSALATVTGLAVGAVVGIGLVWSWRRRPTLRALLGTAVFGVIGAGIVVGRLPVTFGVAGYRTWSLWVVSLFAWIGFVAVVIEAGRELAARRNGRRREHTAAPWRWVEVAVTIVLVVFAFLGATGRSHGLMRDRDDSRAVRSLVDQTRDQVSDRGPYLAVQRVQGLGSGVLWGLERHGFDLRVARNSPFDAPYLAATHGPAGQRWRRIEIVEFPTGARPDRAGRLVAATTVPATPDARRVYRDIRAQACGLVRKHPPTVTARGRALLARRPQGLAARALRALVDDGAVCRILRVDAFDELRRLGALRFSRSSEPMVELLSVVDDAGLDQRVEVRVLPAASGT